MWRGAKGTHTMHPSAVLRLLLLLSAQVLLTGAQSPNTVVAANISKNSINELLKSLFPDSSVGFLDEQWGSDTILDSDGQIRGENGVHRTFEFDKNNIVKTMISRGESSYETDGTNKRVPNTHQVENMRQEKNAQLGQRHDQRYMPTTQQTSLPERPVQLTQQQNYYPEQEAPPADHQNMRYRPSPRMDMKRAQQILNIDPQQTVDLNHVKEVSNDLYQRPEIEIRSDAIYQASLPNAYAQPPQPTPQLQRYPQPEPPAYQTPSYRPHPRMNDEYNNKIPNNAYQEVVYSGQDISANPQHSEREVGLPSQNYQPPKQIAVQNRPNQDTMSHLDSDNQLARSQRRLAVMQQDQGIPQQSNRVPLERQTNTQIQQIPEDSIRPIAGTGDEIKQEDQQVQDILAGVLQQLNQSAGGGKRFQIGDVKVVRAT